MSNLDIAKLMEIITTPADSSSLDVTTAGDNSGLVRRKYTWRWGKITDPDRVTIVIMTVNEPVSEEDGSLTVFYDPMGCAIMKGGELLRERYVGVGLYSFNYDEEKPELVRELAMALRPLSNSVRPAPSVTGL